jgi:hypothetical protein
VEEADRAVATTPACDGTLVLRGSSIKPYANADFSTQIAESVDIFSVERIDRVARAEVRAQEDAKSA